ncbi:hypothetical protein [Salinicoccus halodurans]|uniref:Helix-turn-helix domain-containing protein n=1 Tax=Salinicoccus halodurans TaxID=407035 RepID=A0A0F7HI53_9STAP|nr:hypothetical protein [Salinicoccus halodurans]AKG72934.1 hypothetical protein AAT16_01065 [Salinicoccus halodurans]SFK76343.1 hypothetical protein SAMN05216235_1585 [Salinicoccus halodurans]
MEMESRIIEGRLTAYQISEALGISIDTANDLLDEKLKVDELDQEVREKLETLEQALFDQ